MLRMKHLGSKRNDNTHSHHSLNTWFSLVTVTEGSTCIFSNSEEENELVSEVTGLGFNSVDVQSPMGNSENQKRCKLLSLLFGSRRKH